MNNSAMKNIFFIVILTLLLIIGQYLYQDVESTQIGNQDVLEYIPNDTAIFSGFLTPFPIKNFLYSLAKNPAQHRLNSPSKNQLTPAQLFFETLTSNFSNQIHQPQQALQSFGLANNLQTYFYTFGLKPVFKFQIKQPKAFFKQLDIAEKQSQFPHQLITIAGNPYRQYALSANPENSSLIIGEKNNWITVTLHLADENNQQLQQSLGLKTVKHSLASTERLKNLKQNNHFLKENISFIDHEKLLNLLINPKFNNVLNPLSQLLSKPYTDRLQSLITELNIQSCNKELLAITNQWPMTVFGLTDMSISTESSNLTLKLKLESSDKEMLDALTNLRGFIPPHISNNHDNVLALGVGINANNLTTNLSLIWDTLTETSLTCPLLANIQNKLNPNLPMMYSIAAGMLQGMVGGSLSIQDYKLKASKGKTQLANLDALITLSSEKPEQILNVVKAFIPMFGKVNFTDKNQPIDLSALMSFSQFLNIKPMMTIKGNNLVIYSGEKSEKIANSLIDIPLSFNHLFELSLNANKLNLPAIYKAIYPNKLVTSPAINNYQINIGIDIDNKGIIFNSRISL